MVYLSTPRWLSYEPMTEHKYRVIRRLEAGGMAEVFVGEAVSVQGFKKRVAIKRVLPHLAQNEAFIQMFLDEARLSARLDHANIVSVFDISAREDTYFLIMELVDGANLKKILESRQARGKSMPLGDAVYICMEACRGLSYAHELTDDAGTPLQIVHRDISPPNILVTKRGEVKVADFGLAKAGTQLSQTDPGVVKGKFSYLSPEAANGIEVDARADIFSLGIVLWEMLAGRRLFLGDTDYATVKLIQKANVPRLAPLSPDVDEAFEEVLLRALATDRSQRYRSAREFGDALAGYLFARQMKVTSYDIAALVTDATSTEVSVAGKSDDALIDRLIQEELNESVAIGSPISELAALTPKDELRDTGELEDPASWFSEDELGTGTSDAPISGLDDPGAAFPPERGTWREAGVEASPPGGQAPAPGFPNEAPTDEVDVSDLTEVPPEIAAAPIARAAVPAPTSRPSSPTATASRGGLGKFIVAAVVVLLIGVGLVIGVGTR